MSKGILYQYTDTRGKRITGVVRKIEKTRSGKGVLVWFDKWKRPVSVSAKGKFEIIGERELR